MHRKVMPGVDGEGRVEQGSSAWWEIEEVERVRTVGASGVEGTGSEGKAGQRSAGDRCGTRRRLRRLRTDVERGVRRPEEEEATDALSFSDCAGVLFVLIGFVVLALAWRSLFCLSTLLRSLLPPPSSLPGPPSFSRAHSRKWSCRRRSIKGQASILSPDLRPLTPDP
jgi:hypothetical protein